MDTLTTWALAGFMLWAFFCFTPLRRHERLNQAVGLLAGPIVWLFVLAVLLIQLLHKSRQMTHRPPHYAHTPEVEDVLDDAKTYLWELLNEADNPNSFTRLTTPQQQRAAQLVARLANELTK